MWATRVIQLPEPRPPGRAPSTVFHARLFIAAFALIALLGSLLLMLPWVTENGQATPTVDAAFTAVSALAVTGLVTHDTATHWNFFGELIILVLIQIGGLGFMVGASFVLGILGGDRLRHQLMVRENIPTLTIREAAILARRIAVFTFAVEGIGAVLLTAHFTQDMPFHHALWQGVFTSISAFCNAGFDLQGGFQSFIGYRDSVPINVILIVLIQLGALSYLALSDLVAQRRWHMLALNTKVVLTFNSILVMVGTFMFMGAEWNGAMGGSKTWVRPLQALFQSVTARTAGFSTVDFGAVSSFTDFSWVALMFIGGASGSTAGGVKLTTVAIILVAVLSEVRARPEPQIFRRRLPISMVMRAITVVTLFFLFHFTMTLALAGTEHLYQDPPSFVAILFEAMSAMATVGLSTGITPDLSVPGKLIIILTMFAGRLGPLTIAYALAQRESGIRYRYPEGVVHIG